MQIYRSFVLRLSTVLAALVVYGTALAENWPAWRGPRNDGSSIEHGLPTEWDGATGKNIAWKVPVPGVGHASPIVWQDRIFLVSALEESKERILISLDRATGKTLWQRTVLKAPLEKKHNLNSCASSTPATDGQLVYVSFLEPDFGIDDLKKSENPRGATPGNMVVAAYDLKGNRCWLVRPGRFSSVHGYCSPPTLFEDLVIVNGDHDGDAYLVALDRRDGHVVWKTPRENKTRSYCAPIIRQIDGRTQMILSGSLCVASYDPRDGSRHWIIDGPTEQYVASLVYNGDLLFMTAGFPEHHIMAIRPDGQGNVTDTAVVWHTQKGCSYVPSPIASADGRYFLVVSDKGVASLFEASTGEHHWMERIGPHYSASLVTVDGLVHFLSDEGVTTVVRPGPEFDVVAENALGEECRASPAISQGRIYIRSLANLFAIGPAETAKPSGR